MRKPWAALAILLVQISGVPLQAQESDPGSAVRFSASLLAFREDGRADEGGVRPGLALSARGQFFRVFHADLTFANVLTFRENEWVCPPEYSCPENENAWGFLDILSGSIGLTFSMNSLRPYLGVGRGLTWDSPPGVRTGYDGPNWVWYLGVERDLNPQLGWLVEYRGVRTYWDNDYKSVLKDIHLTNHVIGFGITYAPWRR